MKFPTRDIPGHETIYVECLCDEDERETLFEKLRNSASDAIQVQLHNDQQGINKSNIRVLSNCLTKFLLQLGKL